MQAKITKRKVYWFSVSIVGIILGLSLQMAYAWVAPVKPAPSQEVGAPLNTSLTDQTKEGGLAVNGRLSVKEVCIHGDCKTSWPGATAPAVTSGAVSFSAPGQTSTWTVPAGVGLLHVQMWGGGGGGGAGAGSDVQTGDGQNWINYAFFTGGGGGASGGYVSTDIPVIPGQKVWVYTAKGGKGASANGYVHQSWDIQQTFGGSGEKSWLIVTDASVTDISSLVSQNKFTSYANGGTGGENYGGAMPLKSWLYFAGTPPFGAWWQNNVSKAYYCYGSVLSTGGSAWGPTGSTIITGNKGAACNNVNSDTAGGAAVTNSQNSFAYGKGGNGVAYGTIPIWSCPTESSSCDDLGNCSSYTTYNNSPYDSGSCSLVQADGHANQKGKDGDPGNVLVAW